LAEAAAKAAQGQGKAAAEEEEVQKVDPVAQEESKRVFNVEDDTWRDASVPGSAMIDDIPEIDASKMTKKELKKATKDRENLIKMKV
jgi:hypothetical protein